MEVLSRALAAEVSDLRTEHEVIRIELESRRVLARIDGRVVAFRYRESCLSTLPLPRAIELCDAAEPSLRRRVSNLKRNRVRTVAFCVRGTRPTETGLWRYFTDPELAFTRLVFMNEFDPLLAPADGFGVMAEIVERGEVAPIPDDDLIQQAQKDIISCGILPEGCRIEDARVFTVDPAYVVFEAGMEPTFQEARSLLSSAGITPLGRYGHWEYSSMAQVIRDGYAWADAAQNVRTSA